MLTRGILRSDIPSSCGTPVVLRVSGANSVLDDDLSNETIITDIDEVIRLNAAGMALSIFVGSAYQHQTIANLAKLVDLGERYGIPVIAVTAVGKEMVRDARYLALATRIAAEMGAHIVKTYYVEDDFERITSTCPVPVVMAGGKKLPERDALQMTYNAIARGASGVDMGRNIFQSDCPLGMIKAVNSVVHGDASVDDAYAVYQDEKVASGQTVILGGVSADDSRKI
jgi:putative autoinducer-2 (AI-2) aldolase